MGEGGAHSRGSQWEREGHIAEAVSGRGRGTWQRQSAGEGGAHSRGSQWEREVHIAEAVSGRERGT